MERSQEITHARSEEEEDILIRGNKKVRADSPPMEIPLSDTEMTQKETPAVTRHTTHGN